MKVKCHKHIVRNNEAIMKKEQQKKSIQSISKSDEKNDNYSEVAVCPKCGHDEIFSFHGSNICLNKDCDWAN